MRRQQQEEPVSRKTDDSMSSNVMERAAKLFDRLIIAQAKMEGLAVVTRDSLFGDYGVRVIW